MIVNNITETFFASIYDEPMAMWEENHAKQLNAK